MAIGEMALDTIGGARAVSLAGIGAIALVLVVNSVGGKVQPKSSIFSPQLSSPQIVNPLVVETLQAAVVDPIAAPPKEEPRPRVTLTRDEIGEVQAWCMRSKFPLAQSTVSQALEPLPLQRRFNPHIGLRRTATSIALWWALYAASRVYPSGRRRPAALL